MPNSWLYLTCSVPQNFSMSLKVEHCPGRIHLKSRISKVYHLCLQPSLACTYKYHCTTFILAHFLNYHTYSTSWLYALVHITQPEHLKCIIAILKHEMEEFSIIIVKQFPYILTASLLNCVPSSQ